MATGADPSYGMSDYAGLLRRRWVFLATIIPAAMLLAVYLAFTLPAVYRSSVTILLEAPSINEKVVQTTVGSYADQQIELVQRKVMTRETLKEVVAAIDPYPDEEGMTPGEKAGQIISDTSIERVDPVTLEALQTSNAFSIYYHNASPTIAQQVNEKLAELFLTYNLRTRSDQARQTYDFLLVQSNAVAAKMQEIEQRLAQFKERYGDALPEAQIRNQQALDRTERDLDGFESQLRTVQEREALLRVQLNQISPSLIGSVGTAPTDLPTLRAELASAEQRYTPDHPDVKRLRRAIEALRLESGSSSGQRAVKADNPEYLTVESQLDGAQREAAALRSNVARARTQIASYRQRLENAPSVEREYAQLDREHQVTRAQYQEIQEKLHAANMAQNLESEQIGERYTLIRPASTPSSPFSPNRLGIILIGLVLGGAIAIGSAAFVESSDPTVRSARDLFEFPQLATLGAIPILSNPADSKRRLLRIAGSIAAFAVATLFVAFAVIGR